MGPRSYQPRLADAALAQLMESFTAVMVTGPRAAGKTTTAARVAAQVVRLDQPAPAAAFRADPDAALRRTDRPVLLDEWQNVPEVLGAVKRAVDGGAPPGSFVLAGSVRADLEQEVWPLTGRAIRLRMYGLTEREINGIGDPSISALDNLTAGGDDVTLPATVPDLPGYIDLAVRGSFPETALHLQGGGDRQRWLDSYLAQLLSRDALAAGPGRDPVRLRRYFEALAASTAGAPADLTLYDAAGINARTATGYDGLLERLFVTESVPAYSHNRLTRLARGKKRYVLDTGLVGSALQVTADEVLGDPDLFGRILDTFATAQLRAELALAPRPHQLFHLRDKNGRREIDLLIDLGRKGVFGIEIKAAAAPSPPDAGHLCWLRDQLGRRFIGGAVLHTGPGVYELGERILAMPLCVLWS